MGVKAILSTLPYKIKSEAENEIYKNYIAKGVQMTTKNSAIIASYLTRGEVEVSSFALSYNDIINPKPEKHYIKGEIAEKIKSKFR